MKVSIVKVFVLYALVSLLPVAQLMAQNTVKVAGTVADSLSHLPVEGAVIYLGEQVQVSNRSGEFQFTTVKPGEYTLNLSLLGYRPQSKKVKVSKNIRNLHIDLAPLEIRVKPVVILDDFLLSGPKESSQSVEQVGREFLEKNYGNTFSNSLEKIPGFTTMNTGVGIAKPVIRGMTFNRVIVNENGIKQEGQQWGADHGLELDQFKVEKVEIVKGPGSLMYGSDGLGGILNVLPGAIPESGTLQAELSSFYRSNNQGLGLSAAVKGNWRNNFLKMRWSQVDFGDYRVPAETFTYNSFVLPLFEERLKNTAGNERNFSIEGGTLRDWGLIRVTFSRFAQQAGLFPGAIGIPRSYLLTPDGDLRNIDLPSQEITHLKGLLNAKIFLGKHLWETDFGIQDNNRVERSYPHLHGYGPAPEGDLAHGLQLRTVSGNSRLNYLLNSHFKIKTGISFQQQENQRQGFEFLIPGYTSIQSGLYALGEYERERNLSINGGLRFDVARVRSSSFIQPIYEPDGSISSYQRLSPDFDRTFSNVSGAIGLSFYPSDHFNLKVNLARSFRYPTAPELLENGVHHGTFRHERGDSSLNPEIGYQTDLALIWQNQPKNLLIKLSPFINLFQNYIYLKPSASFSPLPDAGQIYQYTENTAIHSGGELFVEYHLLDNLHLSTGVEYVHTYNLDNFLPLPFTPPLSVYSQAEYSIPVVGKRLRELFFSLEWQATAAQNRVDRNENATPGYHLLHFGTGFQLKLGSFHPSFNLRIQNLGNTRYLNHLSRYRLLNLPEQGRNFSISLKIPLNIINNHE